MTIDLRHCIGRGVNAYAGPEMPTLVPLGKGLNVGSCWMSEKPASLPKRRFPGVIALYDSIEATLSLADQDDQVNSTFVSQLREKYKQYQEEKISDIAFLLSTKAIFWKYCARRKISNIEARRLIVSELQQAGAEQKDLDELLVDFPIHPAESRESEAKFSNALIPLALNWYIGLESARIKAKIARRLAIFMIILLGLFLSFKFLNALHEGVTAFHRGQSDAGECPLISDTASHEPQAQGGLRVGSASRIPAGIEAIEDGRNGDPNLDSIEQREVQPLGNGRRMTKSFYCGVRQFVTKLDNDSIILSLCLGGLGAITSMLFLARNRIAQPVLVDHRFGSITLGRLVTGMWAAVLLDMVFYGVFAGAINPVPTELTTAGGGVSGPGQSAAIQALRALALFGAGFSVEILRDFGGIRITTALL